MFFQKNISWDLKLDKRLRVNKTTCYIIFNFFTFQHSFFIFLLLFFSIMRIDSLFIISLHLSEHRIQLFRKVIHALTDLKKTKTKTKIERSENQLNVMFFKFAIEHSICWLHHKTASINVINSENRDEASEVKINSSLRFSSFWAFNMLITSQNYIDKCNKQRRSKHWRKSKRSERDENQLIVMFFKFVIEFQYVDYIINLHR